MPPPDWLPHLNGAREFAGSLGGRLVLSVRTPPIFTLLLPGPNGSGESAQTAPRA